MQEGTGVEHHGSIPHTHVPVPTLAAHTNAVVNLDESIPQSEMPGSPQDRYILAVMSSASTQILAVGAIQAASGWDLKECMHLRERRSSR
jgi:hypothetical protein